LFIIRHVVTAQLNTLVSTRSTRRTCRDMTWRSKWSLGYT